jgi:hypothetical protein
VRDRDARRGTIGGPTFGPSGHHSMEIFEANAAISVGIKLREDERDSAARQLRGDALHRCFQVRDADVALGPVIKGTKGTPHQLVGLLHGNLPGDNFAKLREADAILDGVRTLLMLLMLLR